MLLSCLLDLNSNHGLPYLLAVLHYARQIILWPCVGSNSKPATVHVDEDGKRTLAAFRDTDVQVEAFKGRGLEVSVRQGLLDKPKFHVTANRWGYRRWPTTLVRPICVKMVECEIPYPYCVAATLLLVAESTSGAANGCAKEAYCKP